MRSLILRRVFTFRPGTGIVPITVLALLVTGGCSAPPPGSDASYLEEVTADRAWKDETFLTGADSPIPGSERSRLLPLAYYPVDPDYRVLAALAPAPTSEPVEMPTSTGKRRLMRRAGVLEFSLHGEPLRLTAFVEASDRSMTQLFVPFADFTNGGETYVSGRYLDLPRTATGLYDLDFNRAYHPYCYYNAQYDCPYPPPENRLQVAVRAGERLAADTTARREDTPP